VEVSKLMSSRPHVGVRMGGVAVSCLVDTGSRVSTITESLFKTHTRSEWKVSLKTIKMLWLGRKLSLFQSGET
jgi:hypothetical protein